MRFWPSPAPFKSPAFQLPGPGLSLSRSICSPREMRAPWHSAWILTAPFSTFTGVTLGSGASGAFMFANTNQAASGRIGFDVAFFGSAFSSGTNEVVDVTFQAALLTNTVANVRSALAMCLRPAKYPRSWPAVFRDLSRRNRHCGSDRFGRGCLAANQWELCD